MSDWLVSRDSPSWGGRATESAPSADGGAGERGLRGGHFSDSLVVEGPGSTLRLDAAELVRLADFQTGPVQVCCFSGRPIREIGRLRGVPLAKLLDLAGMAALPRSRSKQLVVAAEARDGYVCLFSWHELYNTALGAGAVVAVEQDGVLLPAAAGGLQLLSLGDRTLGPRQASALWRVAVRSWGE
ncbi:hypothetical protein PIGHUM_00149 [Pigmentiphaga humi]|uniref:Oxidoreductase molybdopterin binding domain protein n=1 Tax=Pigmentiphaga humi TaxID=2478468 RepID=A0A3P4AX54_9BURK|nr:molybdopterin-binding protein [Pigmentiphaga humi]VCU68101.1 hypothetical protein PIGHUM_00149 [Pigmentiphaga humi]